MKSTARDVTFAAAPLSFRWWTLWNWPTASAAPRHRRSLSVHRTVIERLESRWLLTVYEVGPGLSYTSIGAVPWSGLQAGDTVEIHYRAEPYHELIQISGTGTEDAPIRVVGIAGPNGERPIIDGDGAVLGPNLDYIYSGIPTRGLVTISPNSTYTWGDKPSFIEISGLQIRNAHLGNSIVRPGGTTSAYLANVAGIYVERGENITIRDCEIDHNSNGLFVASGDDEATQSRDILIQANYIHDNGNVGSDKQHNVYTEAIGITFEDNRLAPLVPGAGGNNVKDRSAGLIIRNNWIEGGAHLLDLVDAEGSYNQAGADPRYQQTFVYGNVLLNTSGPGNASNLIHYGGDSGDTSIYRKGTLYFYQNTVVIQGTRTGDSARWFTNVFQFDTNEQVADIRNNIIYASGDPDQPNAEPTGLALFSNSAGTAYLGDNWISPDWHTWRNDDAPQGASITGTENLQTNADNDPGFVDLANYDLHLTSTSPAIDQAGPLPSVAQGAQFPSSQYVVHQGHADRTILGDALDFGAFEGSGPGTPAGPGRFQFQTATQKVNENAGVIRITVRRVGGTSGTASVSFATIGGTAVAGVDFTATSGTLEFADGQATAEIDVTILDNLFSGPNKTLQLKLSNPTSGATLGSISQLGLTIQNDESQTVGKSTVGLQQKEYSARPADGQVVITVTRDGDLSQAGQVKIMTKGGTARTRSYFTSLSQTLTFAPGQSTVQVTIQLQNQPVGRGRKVFQIALSNASGGVTLNPRGKIARITLKD